VRGKGFFNAADLLQVLVFEVRPLQIVGEDVVVVVDERRHDRDDALDVALLRHRRRALRPEQRRPEDDGDVERGHLRRLAVFGKLVQKLERWKRVSRSGLPDWAQFHCLGNFERNSILFFNSCLLLGEFFILHVLLSAFLIQIGRIFIQTIWFSLRANLDSRLIHRRGLHQLQMELLVPDDSLLFSKHFNTRQKSDIFIRNKCCHSMLCFHLMEQN